MESSRRQFFNRATGGMGLAALSTLLKRDLQGAETGLPGLPHFAPRAKRVIYLFMSGGPSQMELFDYKPKLVDLQGTELPASIRMGQRLTGMTATQASFPVAPSKFAFRQHGKSGAWVSELLPHTAKVADEICFLKTLNTAQINHDPGITFFQTGFQLAGRPSIGAWVQYGLGSANQDLPAYIVLISQGTGRKGDQPLYDRLWGSGFLPSKYQGVKFRGEGDPVLNLSNPPGFESADRRRFIDDLSRLNQEKLAEIGDPEIATRISQYEMAFRMQASVPELADLSKEPESTFALYGPESRRPGSFAANCLLARRLAERGVRFIQLFHRGWDMHDKLPEQLPGQARDIDQPAAALISDLKQRGMLNDTVIVWGGEFGRTVYCQGKLTKQDYGRDHHPRCFTVWMAGGGVKPGISYGETDDFCYNIVSNPVDVHDLHATIMHLMGVDHLRLTYKYQGRHFRLTDVHGKVVKEVLA
jgi:hypothetical protein